MDLSWHPCRRALCHISSHVFGNHEADGTTVVFVNICARYENPLLPHLLQNAKCLNQSERQQEQETFGCEHLCVEEMGGLRGNSERNMAAASVVSSFQ